MTKKAVQEQIDKYEGLILHENVRPEYWCKNEEEAERVRAVLHDIQFANNVKHKQRES